MKSYTRSTVDALCSFNQDLGYSIRTKPRPVQTLVDVLTKEIAEKKGEIETTASRGHVSLF